MMATSTPIFERLVAQVQELAPADQLRLITRIAERLAGKIRPPSPQPLIYGQYHGPRLSTEADFAIAEWRPTDSELDGD